MLEMNESNLLNNKFNLHTKQKFLKWNFPFLQNWWKELSVFQPSKQFQKRIISSPLKRHSVSEWWKIKMATMQIPCMPFSVLPFNSHLSHSHPCNQSFAISSRPPPAPNQMQFDFIFFIISLFLLLHCDSIRFLVSISVEVKSMMIIGWVIGSSSRSRIHTNWREFQDKCLRIKEKRRRQQRERKCNLNK